MLCGNPPSGVGDPSNHGTVLPQKPVRHVRCGRAVVVCDGVCTRKPHLRPRIHLSAQLRRTHKRLLPRMHGDVAGARDCDVAAFDGDGCATLRRQVYRLAGGQFDLGVGADEFQLILRLQPGAVLLGLQDQFGFGADDRQGVGGAGLSLVISYAVRSAVRAASSAAGE